MLTGFRRDDEEGGNGLEAGVPTDGRRYACPAGTIGAREKFAFDLRVTDYAMGKVGTARRRFGRRDGLFLPR